jgi:hypothetical protein
MTEIFLYASYSDDGLIFSGLHKMSEIEGEDPYAIIKDGIIHVFFENSNPTNDKILHLTSSDGLIYKLEKDEIKIKHDTFYSDNIGNPLVFFDSILNTYVMLFEGMKYNNKHLGKVGVAFSDDLVKWEIRNNYIEIGNRKKWMIDNTIRYGTKIIDGVDDTYTVGNDRFITIHCYDQIRGYVSTVLSYRSIDKNVIELVNILEKPLSITSTLMTSIIMNKLYFRFNEKNKIFNAIPVKGELYPQINYNNIGITWEQQ